MRFEFDDGGRKEAGYKGDAGDCVTRAIAIATGKSYPEVYNSLFDLMHNYVSNHNDKIARQIKRGKGRRGTTPRNGVPKPIYTDYLNSIGWQFTPTMQIGSGCTVHLRKDELPTGNLIVRVSKHYTAVIDGILNDTYDCSRNGKRCVYGYWSNET